MKLKNGTAVFVAILVAAGSYADSITHGGTTINMDFVSIGFPGNAWDMDYIPSTNHPYGLAGHGFGRTSVSVAIRLPISAR